MTGIIQFLFDSINKFFDLMRSFEFELFGFQVNILHLFLSFLVIGFLINFLRLGMNITRTEVVTESVRHRIKVNKEKEKQNKSAESARYMKGVRGGRWI